MASPTEDLTLEGQGDPRRAKLLLNHAKVTEDDAHINDEYSTKKSPGRVALLVRMFHEPPSWLPLAILFNNQILFALMHGKSRCIFFFLCHVRDTNCTVEISLYSCCSHPLSLYPLSVIVKPALSYIPPFALAMLRVAIALPFLFLIAWKV